MHAFVLRTISVCVFAFVIPMTAHGGNIVGVDCPSQVETDRVLLSTATSVPGEDFRFAALYFSNDANGTGFRLDGTTISPTSTTLGLQAFWYVVAEGDVVNQETIESGAYDEITPQFDVDQPEVDLGVLGDHFFGTASEGFRDFGWIKIHLSEDEPVFFGRCPHQRSERDHCRNHGYCPRAVYVVRFGVCPDRFTLDAPIDAIRTSINRENSMGTGPYSGTWQLEFQHSYMDLSP